MKSDKKGGAFLRWPWSLVIYILLVLLLRIFAIPVILLLMAWQKKHQPDGPEEGYCLQRTRRRLARLVWAVLFLLIGFACTVTFLVQVQSDRVGWELADYAALVIAGVVGAGATLLGLYEGYTDIRDAFFPEKSRLAKSIRSQLSHPDEAPGVKELFAMVDQDIRENGQWFDRVAVGKEWVLGDDASYIPRIRAVFGRDEIKRHHSKNRTQTTRIVELYILDDRRQVQVTGLRNPSELPMLLECLKLRVPEAFSGSYNEYLDYCGKSEEEWEKLLRDFQRRKGQREAEEFREARSNSREPQSGTPGRGYSAGTMQGGAAERYGAGTIQGGAAEEYGAGTMQGGPTEVYSIGTLQSGAVKANGTGDLQGGAARATSTATKQGMQDQEDWAQWLSTPKSPQNQSRQVPPSRLTLVSTEGVSQGHNAFTMEDVQVAADGLNRGRYQMVDLVLTGGYLWMRVETGDKMDGRCKVSVTRPDPDKLRFFTTRCSHKQAAAWLLEFAEGRFRPEGKDWKDYTRKVEKSTKR